MTSTSTAGGAAAGSAIILKKVTLTASSWIPSTESLSGIIRENMTFESGDFVKLVGKVQIASGYTVTFGAGSSLQGNGNSIEVFGSLVIAGASDNLVEFSHVSITGQDGGSTSINYSHLYQGLLYSNGKSFGDLSLSNSVVASSAVLGWWYGIKPTPSSVIKGNIFSNRPIFADQKDNAVLELNTFVESSTITIRQGGSANLLRLVDNNFLSSSSTILTLEASKGLHVVEASGNYWTTDDVSVIQEKIIDGNDDLNISGLLDVSNRASSYTKAPLKLGRFEVDLTTMKLVKNPILIDADGNLWDSIIHLAEGTALHRDGFIYPAEAQIYRSYYGAMGRLPDETGYNWWLGSILSGRHSLESMASGFVDSNEFKSLSDTDNSGVISNEEFVLHMYKSVFGRDPDAEGLAWWVGQLDTGIKTQPDALINMTQSNEYVELTLGTVADMMFF